MLAYNLFNKNGVSVQEGGKFYDNKPMTLAIMLEVRRRVWSDFTLRDVDVTGVWCACNACWAAWSLRVHLADSAA
jgi:hypothetical protein